MATATDPRRSTHRVDQRPGAFGAFFHHARRRLTGRAAAPTPAVFSGCSRLVDALERAGRDGGVVLAVATAAWSDASVDYLRGALSSASVSRWIRDHATPVLLDASDRSGAVTEMLGVRSLPATCVIRNGVILAKRVGVLDDEELLAWLEQVIGPPAARAA